MCSPPMRVPALTAPRGPAAGTSPRCAAATAFAAARQRAAARRRALFAAAAPQAGPSAALLQELSALDSLLQVDTDDTERQAVELVTALRDRGALRGFGAGRSVPKRPYTLEDLRLNKIDTSKFLAPRDDTLNSVRTGLQVAYLAGLSAAYLSQALDFGQLAQALVGSAFLLTADQVASAGGLEALAVDSAARVLRPGYRRRVVLHEAGHFLVAYLLGLLPRGYTLSSWQAYSRERALGVQAGTLFCDRAFQREVAGGTLSSSSLGVYSCVALAGVATEWMRFGRAEGGVADIQQLDALLRALGFTQAKADSDVRWAVLNIISMLRRHAAAHDALAAAMDEGKPLSGCVAALEAALPPADEDI